MAIENFLADYVKVDEDGDITVTAPKCDVATIRADALSYVRRDVAVGHFGNFRHHVTCCCTAADEDGACGIWGISNGSNTLQQMVGNTEGIGCYLFYPGSVFHLEINDLDAGDADLSIPLVLGTIYYLTIERSGTSLTCKIYDDSARTNLIDTLTVICTTLAYRYVFGIFSREFGAAASITLYSENLDLLEGILGGGAGGVTSAAGILLVGA